MKYTKDMIIRRFNAGEKMKIVAFWGHTPNPGKLTKFLYERAVHFNYGRHCHMQGDYGGVQSKGIQEAGT